MGRPPLVLGTAGHLRLYKTASGYRARILFRDYDGVTRHVERSGRTKNAAEQALTKALRDRVRADQDDAITPDSRLSVVAEQWYAALAEQDRSPSTLQAYRDRLDRQILAALGEVRLRELTVGLVDRHLTAVKAKHGSALAKMTKSVLSGVCGLATRLDALDANPCRDVARISTKPKKPRAVLSIEQVRAIRTWLAENKKAKERDLPDLVAFMAATGLRIGEACAVGWEDVDLDAATVEVTGTVLRLKGQGLINKPAPKSAAGERTLELPSWCVTMLRRRHTDGATGPVFPAPLSKGLRDPSNTRHGLREAFDEMGLPGVTSHAFRRTVATLMDEGGLSARAAADQLGHAKPSMTTDVYYGRKIRKTGAAELLEALE